VPAGTRRTRPIAATLALSAALLAGCQLPDVSMSPGLTAHDSAAAETTAARTTPAAPRTVAAAATPTETAPARPAGDLDTGSLTRTLPAGDRTVVVDYWTAQQATTWTAADDKTIQLSAHLEGGDDAATKVTRFVATVDDGASRTTVTEDRGEFVITPPFSYGTVLDLAPAASDATALTIHVQFDLLVETEPGSGTWFRQTVLDTLQLPLEENHS
jgi:hypothetical protein